MAYHRFLVPAVSLCLTVASGCQDPLVGDWELVELDGEDWPIDEIYSDGGYVYSIEAEASMSIDPDLEGKFEMDIDISYDGDSYGYSYDSDVSAEVKQRRAEYDIEIDGDIEFEMTCALYGDTLECEDSDDADLIYVKVGK